MNSISEITNASIPMIMYVDLKSIQKCTYTWFQNDKFPTINIIPIFSTIYAARLNPAEKWDQRMMNNHQSKKKNQSTKYIPWRIEFCLQTLNVESEAWAKPDDVILMERIWFNLCPVG
jgi:hypothetical protein